MSESLEKLSKHEFKAGVSLASIYVFRMLGLFMLLPVLAIYAEDLSGATPELMGLALGIYGGTQALLQVPFGWMSDKFGRKPIIIFGLLLFAAGSGIAAVSDTVWGVIFGRALQGAGAISSAVLALAADLTRDNQRSKIMAIIGISIGMSFALALVLGPAIESFWGVPGIFWVTAGLAFIAMALLLLVVPTPVTSVQQRDVILSVNQLSRTFRDPQLFKLNVGIFTLHMVLMAFFVAVPNIIQTKLEMDVSTHWQIYLPVLVLSILVMGPVIGIAEKRRKLAPVYSAVVVLLSATLLFMSFFHSSLWLIAVGLLAFFSLFNILEASLPSMVSKLAPAAHKGTALGIYSTCQFAGVFFGGWLGGKIYGEFGVAAVLLGCAICVFCWWLIAGRITLPKYGHNRILYLTTNVEDKLLASALESIAGVSEVVIVKEEKIAYLKVDNRQLDDETLLKYGQFK